MLMIISNTGFSLMLITAMAVVVVVAAAVTDAAQSSTRSCYLFGASASCQFRVDYYFIAKKTTVAQRITNENIMTVNWIINT